MKKYLLALLCFLTVFTTFSQEKLLNIEDAVIGNNRHMYPKYLTQLKWRTNALYTYTDKNKLVEESVKKTGQKIIVSLDILNKSFKKITKEELKNFPGIKWIDENNFSFKKDTVYYEYNLKSKKITIIQSIYSKAENIDYNAKNNFIAYTLDNNLFIQKPNNKTLQITKDGSHDLVYGGNYVHRDEFGIQKGTFWSPGGNLIAFYREDMSNVTNYPLVDITKRIAEVKNIKYPMAGMESENVTIGIFDTKTDKTIYLNTGEPDEHYLTNITWSPDEKYIYISELNRAQNHLKLNKYDVATGQFVKTLFEENNPRYVEPEHPLYFVPGKSEFLFFSERDGYNHLYLYTDDGKLIKQITKGKWVVTKLIGFDASGENIFYVSNERNPIERDVYKLNIQSNEKTLLTKKHGTHAPYFNIDNTFFIDQFSSITTPKDYYLTDNNGNEIKTVFSANNPFNDYKIGEMRVFTLINENGDSLFTRMIKPIDFDSTKKYPVVLYVYGGPHSQLVRNTWMGNSWIWQYYMAQKGYIMLTLDGRGTDYRGFEFESAIHRHLGQLETNDQKVGIDYLYTLPYVDTNRIGVHGWSYGGFMTISLIQKYPEVFKVGVAGGPVTDWKFYEVMYGERYMDTPQENPEGYANSRLTDKADHLKGKLMIIHGAQDGTVVWQNSLEYLRNCVEKDIPVDYFVYPTHEHNVRGVDRIHLMKKVTQYFDDYLY